jgi:hypothetical protein
VADTDTKHIIWRHPAGGPPNTYSIDDSFVHHLKRCICGKGSCGVKHADSNTIEVSESKLFFLILTYGDAHP